ncbi:hypothetical protein GCM10009602_32680 [Nocardiopsis tropica]
MAPAVDEGTVLGVVVAHVGMLVGDVIVHHLAQLDRDACGSDHEHKGREQDIRHRPTVPGRGPAADSGSPRNPLLPASTEENTTSVLFPDANNLRTVDRAWDTLYCEHRFDPFREGHSMRFGKRAGDCHRDDRPGIYSTDEGTLVVQGDLLTDTAGLTPSAGEVAVEIPRHLIEEAARALGR